MFFWKFFEKSLPDTLPESPPEVSPENASWNFPGLKIFLPEKVHSPWEFPEEYPPGSAPWIVSLFFTRMCPNFRVDPIVLLRIFFCWSYWFMPPRGLVPQTYGHKMMAPRPPLISQGMFLDTQALLLAPEPFLSSQRSPKKLYKPIARRLSEPSKKPRDQSFKGPNASQEGVLGWFWGFWTLSTGVCLQIQVGWCFGWFIKYMLFTFSLLCDATLRHTKSCKKEY